MIAELGLFSLILALVFASSLAIIPALGVRYSNALWLKSTTRLAIGQFIFVSLAYVCLTLCFLLDDFTVLYVLNNSSLQLPWFYKLCAVWGGHEGSMLLWVSILSIWILAVALCSRSLDAMMKARVLSVLGFLSIGFIVFVLFTSNPFLRQFQLLNSQGRDLNPLLQDPGFLFHPPMLYMGYVGFSVAFAFAIAVLWAGDMASTWIKWTRPWTLAAWCCLTAGITLGSWWAYRELGWGGWWFWDPVENASFMPWLTGTALIHSLAVSEKRQQFKSWTLLLAIIAFSLSLVGTFLVRSGVLTSVHAFAVDPQRGLYILCFLLIVIGGSLLLFAIKAPSLKTHTNPSFLSKETALLLNNVFLVVLMLTVLLGTTYPLLIDGLGLGKLSVGAPYFNAVFIPFMLPLLFLMGLGIHLRWQNDIWQRIQLALKVLSVTLCVLIFLSIAMDRIYFMLGMSLALWVIISTAWFVKAQIKAKGLFQIKPSTWGMVIAHGGVAILVIGIAVSSSYGLQRDIKIALGESTHFAGFQITFTHETELTGPNYHGARVTFNIQTNHKTSIIYPEKRIYNIGKMPMTESAIDVTPFRDLYIALGEPLDTNAWSVRIYYKPFVRWIWAGGFIILLGGFLALVDKRYYSVQKVSFAPKLEVEL